MGSTLKFLLLTIIFSHLFVLGQSQPGILSNEDKTKNPVNIQLNNSSITDQSQSLTSSILAEIRPDIPEIYTSSVSYRLSSSNPQEVQGFCRFVNAANDQNLSCDGPNQSCACLSGRILGLQQNTVYIVNVFNIDLNAQVGQITFRTASIGTFSVDSSVFAVNYTIAYSNGAITSTSCEASVFDFKTKQLLSKIVKASASECNSGSFQVPNSNSFYEIVVTSGGDNMHRQTVRTKMAEFSLIERNLITIGYEIRSNIPKFSQLKCQIIDSNDGTEYLCLSSRQCSCSYDIIDGLKPDTTYNFVISLKSDGDIVRMQLKTASTGTVSIEKSVRSLEYKINYPIDSFSPTTCYFCIYNAMDGSDLDTCIVQASTILQDEQIYCSSISKSNLNEGEYYHMYLLDLDYQLVASNFNTSVALTNIFAISYQLTSIEYRVNSDIPFNFSMPCQFTNSFNSLYNCEVNGVNTTDCNCLGGKLVGLRIDSYIYVDVLQNNKLIAQNTRMTTAYQGRIFSVSIGATNFLYQLQYPSYSFAPYQCQFCLHPTNNTNPNFSDCQGVRSFYGREWCNGGTIGSLNTRTQYYMVLFDGDGVRMQQRRYSTTGLPDEYEFLRDTDGIIYRLVYNNTNYRLTGCFAFFEQAPEIPAFCYPTSTCTCSSGKILLPPDMNDLTLLITDSFNEVIARESTENLDKPQTNVNAVYLDTGYIVGLVIAIVTIITVILVFMGLSIGRRRKYTFLDQRPSIS